MSIAHGCPKRLQPRSPSARESTARRLKSKKTSPDIQAYIAPGFAASAAAAAGSKHWRGSKNSHDARTNGAVSVGMANGVKATFIAPCTMTVNTVPTSAYATTRALG